jgi:hypothetical protein
LGENFDEWFDALSPRIQANGQMTNINEYSSIYSDEAIDDFYDVLFENEYNEAPFYAIARLMRTKSTSHLVFINTFIENKGIETLMSAMDNP